VPEELKEESYRHSNARSDSNDCLNIKWPWYKSSWQERHYSKCLS
jgi:hypothetical protein